VVEIRYEKQRLATQLPLSIQALADHFAAVFRYHDSILLALLYLLYLYLSLLLELEEIVLRKYMAALEVSNDVLLDDALLDKEALNDALLAQMLYEEELQSVQRCINDEQIATMVNQADLQRTYYEPLKKLHSTSLKSMTMEEQAAYYYLHGSEKYKDIGEENDFYLDSTKKPPKAIAFRFADKKKGEEYGIVVSENSSKVICECLDRQRKLCRKSLFFVSNFHHVDRGDAVIIQIRGDTTRLVFKYTNAQWTKIFESGQLTKINGLNKMPHEVLAIMLAQLKTLPDLKWDKNWFKKLRLVNSVFNDLVKRLL